MGNRTWCCPPGRPSGQPTTNEHREQHTEQHSTQNRTGHSTTNEPANGWNYPPPHCSCPLIVHPSASSEAALVATKTIEILPSLYLSYFSPTFAHLEVFNSSQNIPQSNQTQRLLVNSLGWHLATSAKLLPLLATDLNKLIDTERTSTSFTLCLWLILISMMRLVPLPICAFAWSRPCQCYFHFNSMLGLHVCVSLCLLLPVLQKSGSSQSLLVFMFVINVCFLQNLGSSQ